MGVIVDETPETREDIETGGEYSAYHVDVGRVMELLRPGDRVTLTRTSDAPAPHAIEVTRDTATAVEGRSMDGANWVLSFTGVPTVAPSYGKGVAIRGLVVTSLSTDE